MRFCLNLILGEIADGNRRPCESCCGEGNSIRGSPGLVARRLAVIAFATLASLSNTPAISQTAERPDVKVGDRWQFAVYYTVASTTPSRNWLITSVSETSIEGTEDGGPLTLTRELNVIESPRQRESNPRLLSFPLTIGKRWHYESDWLFKPKGSNGHVAVGVSVIAYESVKVPAGKFDAFKLTSKEKLSGTSPIGSRYDGETSRTYWYAPAARAIVKSISHNPYLGPSTVELVSFELQR